MNIHIGEIIEKKFQESGIKMGAFAERINTVERNVYDIFKRKDIKADLLRQIGEALSYNFFDLYAPKDKTTSSQTEGPKANEFIGRYQLTFGITNNGMNHFKVFNDEVTKIASKYGMIIL